MKTENNSFVSQFTREEKKKRKRNEKTVHFGKPNNIFTIPQKCHSNLQQLGCDKTYGEGSLLVSQDTHSAATQE